MRFDPHLINCDLLVETLLAEGSTNPTGCFIPTSLNEQFTKNRELSS